MRSIKSKKKIYLPDPKFKDSLVTRFVNNLMKHGKKMKAYNIFYDAMEIIENEKKKFKDKSYDKSAIEIWKQALKNIMPNVSVKTKRIGGSNVPIPVSLQINSKISKSIKFLIQTSRERKEKTMSEKLALEIISAYKGEGNSIRKKENIHKIAESNKAFSHFRF
ncbi:30S ribosomal protein S7 [Candidatus Shikimatogenerans silvanidophilus]|uniref:30S ribosomal protein S7 n=1 Tax=Candidatus Shikimatogenerans silvanidophilus TaxID=2782547 RepID=UPI001BA81E24|nr:30S ribosomal protein S7 [Candidatus Shikimatogenerans silvanidophilus]